MACLGNVNMEVGTSPVRQDEEVTKLVFPKGPFDGWNNCEMRCAVMTGNVSPLRFTNTSHAGADDDDC